MSRSFPDQRYQSSNFKFTPVDYTNKAGKTVTALKYMKGQRLPTLTHTVTEVKVPDSAEEGHHDPIAAAAVVTVSVT